MASFHWVHTGLTNESDAPTILHLHGGGTISGSSNLYVGWYEQLSRAAHMRVLGFDYPLAPEWRIDEAVRFVVEHGYRRLLRAGVPARRIALLGDSGGGLLALLVAQAIRDDATLDAPGAVALLSPMTDLTRASNTFNERQAARDAMLSMSWIAAVYQVVAATYTEGAAERTSDARASPAHARFENLPPLLVMVGENEVLRGEGVAVAHAARKAGTYVELDVRQNVPHVWPVFSPLLPEASEGLGRLAAFLEQRCNSAFELYE